MSSFLLQDIPRHDTRVIEVREAFEHISLLGFHPNISADTAKKKSLRRLLRGSFGAPSCNTPYVACCCPATDAGPLLIIIARYV